VFWPIQYLISFDLFVSKLSAFALIVYGIY